MAKNATFKIYGNRKRIGEDYYEAPYTEYFKDGDSGEISKHGVGTEDFSKERWNSQTKTYDVYKHTGQTYHGAYREGWKMTECVGQITMSKNAPVKEAIELEYGEIARYEWRSGYNAKTENAKKRREQEKE